MATFTLTFRVNWNFRSSDISEKRSRSEERISTFLPASYLILTPFIVKCFFLCTTLGIELKRNSRAYIGDANMREENWIVLYSLLMHNFCPQPFLLLCVKARVQYGNAIQLLKVCFYVSKYLRFPFYSIILFPGQCERNETKELPLIIRELTKAVTWTSN